MTRILLLVFCGTDLIPPLPAPPPLPTLPSWLQLYPPPAFSQPASEPSSQPAMPYLPASHALGLKNEIGLDIHSPRDLFVNMQKSCLGFQGSVGPLLHVFRLFIVAFTQATGPLTQATGPPRSGGGVAIGMLRGNPVLSAI